MTLQPQRVVNGAIAQGDHVEVFGTFTNKDVQSTRVVIADALVLAPATTENAYTATLAVTPADAASLIYAQEQGHVWLTLVPPNESGTDVPAVTSRTLR